DPKMRDPRGYIIPSDQADFPTATEFVNALLKNGITVMKSTAAFSVTGKNYPSGSYVIKTAQAFRPHVMDMFEPQDHPNDFAYPGGPRSLHMTLPVGHSLIRWALSLIAFSRTSRARSPKSRDCCLHHPARSWEREQQGI